MCVFSFFLERNFTYPAVLNLLRFRQWTRVLRDSSENELREIEVSLKYMVLFSSETGARSASSQQALLVTNN